MRRIAGEVATEFEARIDVQPVQLAQAAPPTRADAPIARMMAEAVRHAYGVEAVPRGIGGGTVAALFRRRGIPAVGWACDDGQAHKPNEYCVIAKMVANAGVYAHLAGQEPSA